MTGWTQDLRYALRRLRQEPGYTAFVVLTLALGLGATIAVFSVVNGVLWTALPFPESGRLVAIWGRFLPESGFDFPQFDLSNPELHDYRTENRTMAGVGGWQSVMFTVGGPGEEPERVTGAYATPGLFSVLRVPPYIGRVIGDSDRGSGPAGVAVLSHGYWKRRFGARTDIVGQPFVINGSPRTIVGVMPETFDFPAGVQVWTPLVIDPADPGNRQGHSTDAIARLADGVSLEQARREMDVLMQGWKARYPAIHTGHFLYLEPLLEDTIGDVRPALSVLLAATGVLLLIVCANVASLVLARAERRAREAAIRSALGSGRWRLARLSLIESGLLASAGGAVGGLLAFVAVAWLRTAEGVALPRLPEIGISGRVVTLAMALCVLVAALLGVLPLLRARAARLAAALRVDTRTASASGRGWLRGSLVVAEVTLAVVLVIGAALLIQSFRRLLSVDAGFRTGQILLATVSVPASAAYSDIPRVAAFFDMTLARAAALPGVTRATLSTNLPVIGGLGVWDFEIEGRPRPGAGQPAWNAAPAFVAAGFFEALDIRVPRGRAFTPQDVAGGEPVAMITEGFARKFFAGEDPVGRRLRIAGSPDNGWARIVGIAGDLRDRGLALEPRPMYFLVHAQGEATIRGAMRQATIILRTAADPAALAEPVRAIVREIDPSMPLYNIRTFDAAVARTVARPRFTALLLSAFAAFGLALGALGVYGVLTYTVAERTHELGIRRALGAPAGGLVRLMLWRGLTPVVLGVCGGAAAALALSDLLREQLFGIAPTDAATYVATAVGVLATSILACLIPTRRALRVSPVDALRES